MKNNYIIIDKILGVPLINELGTFFVGAFKLANNENVIEEIIVLYCGKLESIQNVRINSACYTGDLFHCNKCDCNIQMFDALKYFQIHNNGILIYLLSQDGRGSGTVNKLKSLALMEQEDISTKQAFDILGLDPDKRDYSAVVAILNDLGLNKINLITNNPDKIDFLEKNGIQVLKRIPSVSTKPELQKYLKSKQIDFNHLMEF